MRRVLLLGIVMLASLAFGDSVTGRVDVKHPAQAPGNSANVVVSLAPVEAVPVTVPPDKPFRLAQKNKTFEPHLLVVPVGSTVTFPNLDPFFHNVFSLYNGKRFDLGLYEAGSSRSVRFTRPGVSYIFCNIHSEMSAVVIAMATPYYAVTNAAGEYSIADVPPGQYTLHVWYERATPEELARATRLVTVPAAALPTVAIAEAVNLPTGHKNLYGQDYDSTPPDATTPYDRPR